MKTWIKATGADRRGPRDGLAGAVVGRREAIAMLLDAWEDGARVPLVVTEADRRGAEAEDRADAERSWEMREVTS